MTAIGIYFAGLDQAETNALRSRLNEHAKSHGYTATRGPTAGGGNLAEMLTAIDGGELVTVLLSDGQIDAALEHLEPIQEDWAQVIVQSLQVAILYQHEADEGDIAEFGSA